MAAAGRDPGALPEDAALEVPPGRDHRRARPGGRAFIRSQGGEPVVPGLPRLPGLDLRLAELDGRARDPRRRTSCSRGDIISLDVGVDLRGLGRRRGDHGRRSATVSPATRAAARDDRGGAFAGGRAGAARQPPRRRLARGPAARRGARASRSSARSSATGSAATCTRTRRSPTSASPAAGPSSSQGMVLAIEPMVNAGGPRGPHRRRQLGRLLGRTARWPPTSSSPSRSPRTGPGSSPPGTWTERRSTPRPADVGPMKLWVATCPPVRV